MSKSKPFDPEDMVYDSDGDFNLEDTLENTIGNRAKSPLPHNPPPGQKWQAKQGMARLRLNGAEYSVLACLLDRASKGKGACYPSQEFICKWTFRPERTVKRAVAGLRSRNLIRVIDRGLTSNAYLINWPPLFKAYKEMKACERNHSSNALDALDSLPKVAPTPRTVGPEVAPKPMKGTYEEEEPMTLSEPSSDGSYLVDLKKVEEALQGEQVASPSLPPEGLTKGEIQTKVSGYCEGVWDWMTEEVFEAAADAEAEVAGAGKAIVDAAVLAAKAKGATA